MTVTAPALPVASRAMSTDPPKTPPPKNARDLLMVGLARFYAVRSHVATVKAVVRGESDGVSLRLIDWFITNYAKRHATVITQSRGRNVVHFNVYLSYRAQLKAYSKAFFDPFRRRDRIEFYYDRGECIETTIGQLNFFRWMIENRILEHITTHAQAIEADMLASARSPAPAVASDEGSIVKNMSRFQGRQVVTFE